jgi:hypothetical protein
MMFPIAGLRGHKLLQIKEADIIYYRPCANASAVQDKMVLVSFYSKPICPHSSFSGGVLVQVTKY